MTFFAKKSYKINLSFLFVLISLSSAIANTNPAEKLLKDFNQKQSSGISFTENKGQIHDQNYAQRPDVLYGVMTGNMAVHIKRTGISYQLTRLESEKGYESEFSGTKKLKETHLTSAGQTIYRIDLTWLNCNDNISQTNDEALAGYTNYYLENCPNGALNVLSYKGITLNNLYPGIKIHYYEKNSELKHDYIVAAHADYKQIQIKVEGAEISVNENGSLILNTPFGKIQEGAPIVIQNGKQLKSRWLVKNNTISFEIENYNSNYELIIDPVTRVWGTYYGSGPSGDSGIDVGRAVASDNLDNVYLAGEARSSSAGIIIATSGSHQSLFGGGLDAFLAKFNANGVRQWSTYYGGNNNDVAYGCASDPSGNIFLTGSTGSTNGFGSVPVISTPGCHKNYNSGDWDAFLVQFNSNGVRQWGTFYGGAGEDKSRSCTTDANGNVYIAGYTTSGSGSNIASLGAHNYYFGGGTYYLTDAFLVKFNSNGIRQWATYYGGTGDDWGNACAVDANGNVYLCGDTESPYGISTVGCHQYQPVGNFFDVAFLVQFNSSGVRQWGTYYSGTSDSYANSVATDASNNIYMAGYSQSTFTYANVSVSTPGSHQSAYGGGSYDAYLVKFNSGGVRQWGTFYGGNDYESGYSCSTDSMNNIYLAGTTSSYNGTTIASTDGFQPDKAAGTDAFLIKFNANGIRQWGTYYGQLGGEYGFGCAAGKSGNVYMVGSTNSYYGAPLSSPGSHQPAYGGGSTDAFLVKFYSCSPPAQPSKIMGDTLFCIDKLVSKYSVEPDGGAASYSWTFPFDWLGDSDSSSIIVTPGTSGALIVIAYNDCGASDEQTLNITVADCTGLNENTVLNEKIKVYPNPSNGNITLELNAEHEISMMNALGEVVYSSILTSGTHKINLEHLANGVYMLRVVDALQTIKFIKE